MTRIAIWGFLLGTIAGQFVRPDIPSSSTSFATSSNTYVQGAGVVNAGSKQNFIDFEFSRTLTYGDKIGFYVFDKAATTLSSTSASNEYDCGSTVSAMKSPLLSVSPSVEFNSTMPLPYHNVSVSPSRTPFFGGLAQGRYKLCYCKRPAVTEKNPLGECRPADYKFSAGSYFFYDAPELKQRRSVNSDKNFNRFMFKIKKLNSAGRQQRIVIPDIDTNFQTGFSKTRGCGKNPLFSGAQPSWSNGFTTDDTTQKTPLTLVRSTYTFDEVAYQLPSRPFSTSVTPEGFYSVCMCDSDNIGTGGFSDCSASGMCETRTCPNPQSAPVEIATLFVHDLGFLSFGQKVFALSVADKKTPVLMTFLFSKPAAVWNLSRLFWFARNSVSCGAGDHSTATPVMTIPQSWTSGTAVSVDFSGVTFSTVLDPFRLCVSQEDKSVLDIDNVFVVVIDVTITWGKNMADKISDNNQVGLRPGQTSGITGSKYQKTANTVAQDHGVWFSENFVDLKLDWNASIAPFDEIYAVKSSFPCSVSANHSIAGLGSVRSHSHSIAQGLVSSSFPLDLGNTLWNTTKISPVDLFNTSFVAPTPTAQNANNTLFTDYSLCATCAGCDGFGYDLGNRFRILAALHVYQDVGFEKPYRFNLPSQNIVIASGAVPSQSSSLLFLPTDQLFFADASFPCFDWNVIGSNSNSSAAQFGNATVYTSKSTSGTSSLLNAFQYSFDFSPIPVEKADGRLFKLCVKRQGDPQILEFPGCAVSIIRATTSPTFGGSSSFDPRVYTTSPETATRQVFTLKSVVTETTFNSIRWSFKGGAVDSSDRLSLSAVGDGANALSECQSYTYSYITILASAAGTASISPAISSSFSGMLPGQYALCYCNVKVVGATLISCRTSRDFSQFVGYAYFDGSYPGLEYVKSFAAYNNRPSNIALKLTTGTPLDRMMLVAGSDTCGVGNSLDSVLASRSMSNPTVTMVPTAATKAPSGPTKGPTGAPSTKNPTTAPTKLPTQAPTKLPTSGRRRLLTTTNSPSTSAPVTQAPTKAPTTAAPVTKSPTSAPITKSPLTSVPTEAPTTVFPTKFPTKTPTKNPNGFLNTRSPTFASATAPYVSMGLASVYTFTLVGRFKICYCWHSRYSGVGATSATSTVSKTLKFPTTAPTTSAPTTASPSLVAVGRRRLLADTTFNMRNQVNTTGTTCLSDIFNSQRRFGTEVGILIVHDVYMVSGVSPSNVPTTTQRMAVRAVNNQVIKFSQIISAVFYSGSQPVAWFQSVSVLCRDRGVSGSSTPAIGSFGSGGTSQFQGVFDFSNGMSRGCISNVRRKFDYATVEEAFFYRLCQEKDGITFDFANVLVTVTDIEILGGYQNPLLAGVGSASVKFNEACGFLWSERNWRTQSHFRFLASDKSCDFQTGGLLFNSVDYTVMTVYTMYEGSLIKFFLDDRDYASVVIFGGVPRRRMPYRMCMYIQSAQYISDPYKFDWVDFPDVALFPVSERVKLSARQSNYDTTVQTQCPLGYLGCKCTTASACFSTNIYRDLDTAVGIPATCNVPNNLCVAPSRSLFGRRETYSSVPACTRFTPCKNPGPISEGQAKLFLQFQTVDLNPNDIIKFVRTEDGCSATSGTSDTQTNLQSNSVINVNTQILTGGNLFFRLCVTTSYATLDYYNTGFTRDGAITISPSRHTMKPTAWYNKGNTITFSPTLVNPDFLGMERFPDPRNPIQFAKYNQLHIVQSDDNNPVLYTQWTNFTHEKVLSQDTLRVYRVVDHSAFSSSAYWMVDQICTPSWVVQQTVEQNDMVMEVRVSNAGIDSSGTEGVVSSVQFPALAKGYYTACFCRKTPSNMCQMTSAGMIYSSAAKQVSVTGVGAIASSFRVTPLLDYEITPDLFNTTKSQYITARHFCLSNATLGCASCRPDTRTNQVKNEFDIQLTGGSFPLTITNTLAHGTGTTDKVYNLCFQDPMLMQTRTQVLNTSHLTTTRYDMNDTWWLDSWNYARIGTVYISDLTFEWEQNGGFASPRSSYSVAVGTNTMAKFVYTSSTEVIMQNDDYYFSAAEFPCSTGNSVNGVSTQQQQVPATRFIILLSFNGVTAGRFYRLCLKPRNNPSIFRDFGVDFGVWVTDITPSATTFHFFESFHLSLTASLSLQRGDEFYLLHVSKVLCSEYTTLTAGWVSPNIGVFNYSQYHNMGKMPQVTLSGVYINVPLGYAGYRLCVKRTENSEAAYRDYAGLLFYPEGSNHIVENVVARSSRSRVRILSGLSRDTSTTAGSDTLFPSFTVQINDVIWFQRSDSSCAKDVWNSATNFVSIAALSGTTVSSSRVTVVSTHYDQLNGQYMEIDFNFASTDVTTLPFRLCVERRSWQFGPVYDVPLTQSVVQDYPDIKVTISASAVAITSSPTSFFQQKIKPTSSPAVVPTLNQVVTVYSSQQNNQFQWSFSGTVDPVKDKLAIVTWASTSFLCNGDAAFADPVFLIAASNRTSGTSGPLTHTPFFGSVATGKYFLCYCHAATSVTGDCSNELGWRQTVGFLYSFAVTPSDISVSKLSSSQSSVTVWFDQTVDTAMRMMIVGNSGTCGNVASTSNVPTLTFVQPVAEIEVTGNTLATGLTVSAFYSTATVNVYQLCLCTSSCSSNIWNYGGKIGNLLVHDILLNGQNSPLTLQKLTRTLANVTISQSLFSAGTDRVWFARNDCGEGNHIATQNLTEVLVIPVSGNSVSVNYSLSVPSMALHKLCMKNVTSGKVYSFSSLGFIATDVNLTVTSPFILPSSAIGVSYNTGLEILSSSPSNRVLYFRVISQTCDSACSTTATACTIAADQFSTNAVPVSTSFHVNNVALSFDFSRVNPLNAYRVCVLLDRTANNPKSFIDFNDIRVYPVPLDTQFFVASGAALKQAAYKIFITTPLSGVGTPRSSDRLYFRRFDSACLSTAPTVSDVNTSGSFVFLNANLGSDVDFSGVNMTQMVFRLCMTTGSGVTLDYNTKKLYMTSVVVTTKLCRPSSNACKVSLVVTQPEGLFSVTGNIGSNAISVWFQRETSANRACSAQIPQISSADSSRFQFYNVAGTLDIDFLNVAGSLSTPLKLCVYNSNTRVLADFPSINLYALDVRLTPASGVNQNAATKYVTPSMSRVRITASSFSLPTGSFTWFQLSANACVQGAASANRTTSFTTNTSLAAGVDIEYDFSTVRPPAKQQVAFRLCYVVNNNIIDANTVEVMVLEYSVTPAFVGVNLEAVLVDPAKDVGISSYTFCKIDTACPTASQLTGFSTVNCSSRGFTFSPSTISQLDFSKVQSGGKLLKLCGVRLDYSAPYDVVDLQPKGVFQGQLSINRRVSDFTSALTAVEITWSSVLGNSSGVTSVSDVVWFQARDVACTSTSQTFITSASNTVVVKASPFVGNFDFSKITSSSYLKMCASIGGVVKDFTETTMTLLTVSLGATSVKSALGQNFTVTYTSTAAALGSTVKVFFSSDSKCAGAASTSTSTPAVASTSGAVHSFDFSATVASAAPWYLCLVGNTTTLNVDFSSVYVSDVADLGKTSVSNAAGQALIVSATMSLLTNDTVWFSSAVCSATTGSATASKSSSVAYQSGTTSYLFDFSGTTTSLIAKFSMCVSRNTTLYSYSSSSLIVVPSASLGGPYLIGNRTLNLASLSSFLGTSMVSFVVDTSSCSVGNYVAPTTTVYSFTISGSYRMCVRQVDGTNTDVSGVSVVIQDCSQICSTSRAVGGGCDTSTGKCTTCTPHFTGDQCQNCSAGYIGANCDQCDMGNNYQCSASSSSSTGFCALTNTCAVCQCNGHFDNTATNRCPSNVCVCSVGYSGAACDACSTAYYKTVTNGTSTFTCNNCADKCNKRATSCTADLCQCSDNYDVMSNCRFCKTGFVQNVTSGVCVQTASPTKLPTKSPSQSPSFSPSVSPTVDACAAAVDAAQYIASCADWAGQNFCEKTSSWYDFMISNCPATCCSQKAAVAPTAAAASATCSGADSTLYTQDCPVWAGAGYCVDASFSSFMQSSCVQSCCLVGTASNLGAYSASVDNPAYDGSCAGWVAAGYCSASNFAGFMFGNCARSCGTHICTSVDTIAYAASCSQWVTAGYCSNDTYSSFMGANCIASCRPDNAIYSAQCSDWKSNFCNDVAYAYFMTTNCASSCCK